MPLKGYKQSEKHKKKTLSNFRNLSSESEKIRREKISLFQKGRKRTMQTRKKMSESKKGEKCYMWKGDEVGYQGLHSWIQRNFGKANHCEKCGRKRKSKGKKVWFHWSNKNNQYKRIRNDWWQLCIMCHREYDHISEKTGRKGRIPWNKGIKNCERAHGTI